MRILRSDNGRLRTTWEAWSRSTRWQFIRHSKVDISLLMFLSQTDRSMISRSTQSDTNLRCCSHCRHQTLSVSHYKICDQSRIVRRYRRDLLDRTGHQFASIAAFPSPQRSESGSEVVFHPLGDLIRTNHRVRYVWSYLGCGHSPSDRNAQLDLGDYGLRTRRAHRNYDTPQASCLLPALPIRLPVWPHTTDKQQCC